MSDGLIDEVLSVEEVWPPAPTLPPPEPVRPASFMVLHPTLARVLLSAAAGVAGSSFDWVLQWFSHRAHAIKWEMVIQMGAQLFAMQLFFQFGIPALARAEARKMERKKKAAASEPEAAERVTTE